MEKLSNLNNYLNSHLEVLHKNKNVFSVLVLVLVLYAVNLKPALPSGLLPYINNNVVRAVMITLGLYYLNNDLVMSAVVAVVFLVVMSFVNTKEHMAPTSKAIELEDRIANLECYNNPKCKDDYLTNNNIVTGVTQYNLRWAANSALAAQKNARSELEKSMGIINKTMEGKIAGQVNQKRQMLLDAQRIDAQKAQESINKTLETRKKFDDAEQAYAKALM
jgi:hypothetical protein